MVLSELESAGFRLWLDGDRLGVAPARKITAKVRQTVRTHRREIVSEVMRREWAEACEWTNREYPGGDLTADQWLRHDAAALAVQAAFEAGDVPTFGAALHDYHAAMRTIFQDLRGHHAITR